MTGPVRLFALLLVLALAGVTTPTYAAPPRTLPPTGTDFDYQLGGNRPVPDRVGIVVRDREAEPLEDAYDVCYVNGFQTQESERRFWEKRMRLVLERDGEPVTDGAWNEWLLDIRTDRKRKKLARIVGGWISGCREAGYHAVEFDNLDSWSRSEKLITRADAKRYAAKLVRRAHREGLAAAQKNWAPFDGTKVGFDFAIAEDCARWRECGDYVDHYGGLVLDVEYRKSAFKRACRRWDDTIAVVRRDLALSEKGLRKYC